jgi:lipopolysaccharide export LptBFGC system permease protein LptF
MVNVFSSIENDNYPGYTEGLVGSKDDLIKNSPFIVASKKAIMVSNISGLEYIEISGLAGWGLRRFQGKGSIAKNLNGFFMGIDLKPTRYLSLYSEVDGENISTGINIYSRHFTYQFSVYQAEEAAKYLLDSGSIFLGLNISYTLDNFSEQKVAARDDYYSYYKTISPLIEHRVIVENAIPEDDTSIYEELPMFKELQDLKQKRKEKEEELNRLKKLFEEE